MAGDVTTDDRTIGIISATGPAGRALAARLAAGGTPTIVGSRDDAKAAAIVAELTDRWGGEAMAPLTAADNAAAASCPFVVLATDATHALDVAVLHRDALCIEDRGQHGREDRSNPPGNGSGAP